MRRLLAFILALGLLLWLAACGGKEPDPENLIETTTRITTEPATVAAFFDLEAYKETLKEVFPSAGEIAEVFQPLKDYEGILPDEAVMAFTRYLDLVYTLPLSHIDPAQEYLFLIPDLPDCYPDYRGIAAALTGKLGPGATRGLELKAKGHDYKNDGNEGFEGFQAQMAKAWHEFSEDYPALAGDEGAQWMGP